MFAQEQVTHTPWHTHNTEVEEHSEIDLENCGNRGVCMLIIYKWNSRNSYIEREKGKGRRKGEGEKLHVKSQEIRETKKNVRDHHYHATPNYNIIEI